MSRDDSSGASAVEFALVSVVVFPLLLGMIQYGLLFND
jgi:Flp pilus assembly protein TadG